MSTINVGDWNGFVTALTQATSGDEINITNDIDVQNYVQDFTRSIHVADIAELTINGNNYTIKNIANINFGSSDYHEIFLFTSNTTCHINNLNFSNVWLTSKSTCLFRTYNNTFDKIFVNNSTINIKTKTQIGFGGGLVFENCMITFNQCTGTLGATQSAGANPKFRDCWIRFNDWHEVPIGTDYPAFRNLNRCYLEGNLAFRDPTAVHKLFGCSSCCVNVSCLILGFDDVDTLIETNSDSLPNVINTTKIPALATESSTTFNKLVTDEQMKNAEYLASVGFDIIP